MSQHHLEKFCGAGAKFWDYQQVWNTTDPDLPECCQKTILVAIPCGFLWLFASLEVYKLRRSKSRFIPWTVLNVSRTVASCSLLVLAICEVVFYTRDLIMGVQDTYPVDLCMAAVRTATFVLVLVLVQMERRNGLQSSAVLFIFWLLMALTGAIAYRSHLRKALTQRLWARKFTYATFMIYYPLVVAQLLLSSLADAAPGFRKAGEELGKKPCPEFSASFPSRLFFAWFDGMALKGYRKGITASDMWDLRPQDRSKPVVSAFDRYWVQKSCGCCKFDSTTMDNVHIEEGTNIRCSDCRPSLVWALFRAFGALYLMGAFLKLCADLLILVNPMLLSRLINFVASGEPLWRGYLYAVTMLMVSILQVILQAQHSYASYSVGMRIRSAVTSAVYRKALRLSCGARKATTVGEIVNLMAVDVQKLMELAIYLNYLWASPVQIAVALYLLWSLLGPAVLTGLFILVMLNFSSVLVGSFMRKLQVQQMKNKDCRIKLINEVLNGIKVLKLYAWEPYFLKNIDDIRSKEMNVLRRSSYLDVTTNLVWTAAPILVSVGTFTTYVLLDNSNSLYASKAFVSISIFNVLQIALIMMPMVISRMVQAAVSLKRLGNFLSCEESCQSAVLHDVKEGESVTVENGTFRWDPEDGPTLKGINLRLKTGSLVAIVGSVGSGKSSLINAFLGEMDKVCGTVKTKGSVAYIPQQSWIQNATVRDNVIFGKAYRERFYQRVIRACALSPDLQVLPGGEFTEIGEKGINLSGGQKQRVSIARAVYSDADIYFMDDPLSSVDADVGKHIFEQVIGPNGVLAHKTRVLVTHAVTYLPYADLIIVLNKGAIAEMGSLRELYRRKGHLTEILANHVSFDEIVEGNAYYADINRQRNSGAFILPSSPLSPTASMFAEESFHSELSTSRSYTTSNAGNNLDKKTTATLTTEEILETGKVKFVTYTHYFQSIGLPTVFLALTFYCVTYSCSVGSSLWLSEWSNDPAPKDGVQDISLRNLRLGVYAALGIGFAFLSFLGSIVLAYGSVKASTSLHSSMLTNILRAPMSFFDTTPLGRIINRFSKDIDVIDTNIPSTLRMLVSWFFQILATIVIISFSTPAFLIAVFPIGIFYYFMQNFYMTTSRQLRRLESITRSPIYSHFSETLTGTSVIRAYNRQQDFILSSEAKVDDNQTFYYASIVANRWIGFRLELIGNLIVFCAALLAVSGRESLNPGLVGLSVSSALSITTILHWIVRFSSEMESSIVAVERMKEYSESDSEAPWNLAVRPPLCWPSQGTISFRNFSTRYRQGMDLVLNKLSFQIHSGEKVAIVGRTGAGKSSLALSLFRIIEPIEGSITIDGINISKLGLHELRSRITIIPQDPVLFSGTLRFNLDPSGRHLDVEIWRALELSHLKTFVENLSNGVEHEICEGGENLSVGQRQLVCLARALLRKTKILLLDEATASVDLETDQLIQTTIRKEFADCTVLTIAHRINTVMDYDRVLVLENGTLKEFDKPTTLLRNSKSIFTNMVRTSCFGGDIY